MRRGHSCFNYTSCPVNTTHSSIAWSKKYHIVVWCEDVNVIMNRTMLGYDNKSSSMWKTYDFGPMPKFKAFLKVNHFPNLMSFVGEMA